MFLLCELQFRVIKGLDEIQRYTKEYPAKIITCLLLSDSLSREHYTKFYKEDDTRPTPSCHYLSCDEVNLRTFISLC